MADSRLAVDELSEQLHIMLISDKNNHTGLYGLPSLVCALGRADSSSIALLERDWLLSSRVNRSDMYSKDLVSWGSFYTFRPYAE